MCVTFSTSTLPTTLGDLHKHPENPHSFSIQLKEEKRLSSCAWNALILLSWRIFLKRTMTASDVPSRVITKAMQTESKNRWLTFTERKRPSHHLQQGNHLGLSEKRSCWAEPAFVTRQICGSCCEGAAPTCSVMRFHSTLLFYNM